MKTMRTIMPGLFAVAVLAAVSGAPAFANEKSAQLAMSEASAKIDIVSKQGPDATGHPAFVKAKDKMAAAQIAFEKNKDTEAEWRAKEGAALAEVALEASQLESLNRNRQELQNSVGVLRSELQK